MHKVNRGWETGVGSLQWLVFLLANALTLPIVIGEVFQLPPEEIAGLMQRTFFVVGLTSFLQGWLGHRLPIADGPAGLWLGVFVILGEAAVRQGSDPLTTLRLLEGAMIITGAILFVFGAFRWVERMLVLFTPLVTGSYLLLLAIQLSGVFLKGMLGISETTTEIQPSFTVTALAVFIAVFALSVWGRGRLKSYAVLIGIGVGWAAFTIIGWEANPLTANTWIKVPEMFAWGWPNWDAGLAVSSILVAFVLMSNTVASVAAIEQATKGTSEVDRQKLNRGGLIGGIANAASSLFSTVGMVPLSVSAGFIRMTGQTRMVPFLMACAALAIISFVPYISAFLAMLPGPIAYAALLASFAQMIGIGMNTILQVPLDERRLTILGLTLSLGTAVMFLPPGVFNALPSVLQYILGNGLLAGTLIALVLEQVWRKSDTV